MDKPIRDKSTHEPLNDEEREFMDPATCGWDHPVEVGVTENLGIMPIEVTFEEYGPLKQIARTAGLIQY